MKERAGPNAFWNEMLKQAPELSHQLPQLPVMAFQALERIEDEHRARTRQTEAITTLRDRVSGAASTSWRLRAGALLVAGALGWQPLMAWADTQPPLVLVGAGLGILLLLWR